MANNKKKEEHIKDNDKKVRTYRDVNEFTKFHKLLIENAPEGYVPFYFRCAPDGKEPYTKVGSWLKNPLTPKEAVGWLKEGGNVGIAGLNEDPLVIVDIDDENVTDYKTLKKTLTARSGSRKGVHLYYFENLIGSIPNIPTENAGEIRANNQYVIAPGSYVFGYEDKVENIGKYTVEVAGPSEKIALYDIPQVFRDQLEEDKKNRKIVDERKAKKRAEAKGEKTDKKSAFFDLTVYDIISSVPDPSERFPSVFHASKTGKNTSISNEGLIVCWNHWRTLNAQQALCVLSGKLTCSEAGTGMKGRNQGVSLYTDNDEALFAAWKYAKENRYIPEDDPIPTRAMRYIAVNEGFCEEEDINDGWKLPKTAYNNVIAYLKKEGIEPGRTEDKVEKKKEKTAGKKEEERILNNVRRQLNACHSCDYTTKVKSVITQLSKEKFDLDRLDFLILESFPEIQTEDIEIAKNVILETKDTYAKQWKWTKKNEEEDDDNPIGELSDHLCARYRFITAEDTDEIYFYSDNDGIYSPGEILIKKEAEDALKNTATTKIVNEVLNHIRRRSYTPRQRINEEKTNFLPVQNGLFNLNTYSLEEFTSDKIFTYKLPFEYNSNASYEKYEEFIGQILHKEDVPVIQQFFGYCFLPSLPVHKSLWLHGSGRNGKTQLTLILKKTLGDENVTSVGIEELDGYHRFALARLYSKLLNLVSEPATEKAMRSALFKRAVGGDPLSAEVKNVQKTLDFVNYAKFIILGNQFPEVEDTTIAFWDRVIVIGFPNSFIDDFVPDIGSKLIEENGLSAFFNWCLEGLKQLKANKFHFSTSKSSEEMKIEFEKLSNPIVAFIKERCILDVDYIISVAELYEYYKEYCSDENIEIVGKGELSKKIGELRGVSRTKTRYGSEKKVQWCWRGIDTEPQIDIDEKDNDEKYEQKNVDNIDVVDLFISKPHTDSNTFIDNSSNNNIEAGIEKVNFGNIGNNHDIVEVKRDGEKYKEFEIEGEIVFENDILIISELPAFEFKEAVCATCGKITTISHRKYIKKSGITVPSCQACADYERMCELEKPTQRKETIEAAQVNLEETEEVVN